MTLIDKDVLMQEIENLTSNDYFSVYKVCQKAKPVNPFDIMVHMSEVWCDFCKHRDRKRDSPCWYCEYSRQSPTRYEYSRYKKRRK